MKNIQQNINTKMRRGTSENSWSRSTSWHWRSAAGKKLTRDSSYVIKYQTNDREKEIRKRKWRKWGTGGEQLDRGRVRMSRMCRHLTLGLGRREEEDTGITREWKKQNKTKQNDAKEFSQRHTRQREKEKKDQMEFFVVVVSLLWLLRSPSSLSSAVRLDSTTDQQQPQRKTRRPTPRVWSRNKVSLKHSSCVPSSPPFYHPTPHLPSHDAQAAPGLFFFVQHFLHARRSRSSFLFSLPPASILFCFFLKFSFKERETGGNGHLGRPLQPSFYFHEHFWFLFNFFETPAVAKLRSKRRKRHGCTYRVSSALVCVLWQMISCGEVDDVKWWRVGSSFASSSDRKYFA